MGKHGPCYHCGVTSTPLWRNGPPDKPVLCNACGSRWRTKGTLANYTPLHARESLEEGSKVSLEKNMPFNPKGHNTHKKKQSRNIMKPEFGNMDFDRNLQKGLDDDSSDGSSSGSAGSYSDSCAHIDDMSDATGSFQSNMWDSLVPSRRRSGVIRSKPSPVEKLTKDLHSILHQQSSYLSVSSSDLLYETGTPMGSNEIGHGVQLLRKSNSATKDEESEASSFPIENKLVQSGMPLSVHIKARYPNMENEKYSNLKAALELSARERASEEKFQILVNKDSYLASINLKDVVNFDGFMRYFTCEEQQQLMKYLPETDNANPPASLRSMFCGSQFEESLSYFQHLLKKGVFDLSFPGTSTGECSKLKKVALCNLTKAKLVKQCNILKDASTKPIGKKGGSSTTSSLKRSHEIQMHSLSGPKATVKCSKKLCKNKLEEFPVKFPRRYPHEAGQKSTEGTNVCRNKDISCFSPGSLSASSSHKSCIMDNLDLADSNTDQDLLLLDVRSNTSFPEAELLSSHWLQKPAPESLCEEGGISEKEGSLCCNSSLSFSSKRLKRV